MTPQQMLNAAYQVQQRWPDATIAGFYGNAAVTLDVLDGDQVVAHINCHDGDVYELPKPVPAKRRRHGVTGFSYHEYDRA